MYTNGNGSNGNGNGNGNARKRVKLTLSDLNGVDTVDDHPETLGGEADEGSRLDASPGAKAAELKRESKQTPPGQAGLKDADETLIDDETEENLELLERVEKRKRRTRLLLSFGIIGCAVCALLVAGYLWLFAGSEDAYRVRNTSARNRAGEGVANSNISPQALTVEEITRELSGNRNANSSTAEGQTAPPVSSAQDGATMERGGSPVTSRLPLGDYSTTVMPSPSPQLSQLAAGQNVTGTETGNQIVSGEVPATGAGDGVNRVRAGNATTGSPNPERSIRVSALNNAGANGGSVSASLDNQLRLTSTTESRAAQVSLPPLGTMLPVRTLGTLFTLRSEGYVRMQLTRAVSGQGWSLPRGTELYGVARSSDFEIGRAYVQLIGFIDPSSNRLVRLQGSVLGSDGADGLRGRKHNLNSGWGRALRIAGAGALEALSTVAAGIGRRPVYVGDVYGSGAPRMTSPLMQELNGIAHGQGRAGFVEVPAGTSGYVLVMTSPREIEGVDAGARLPVEDLRRMADAGQERDATRVSEAELAELLTNGNREDIRRALPRMTPEMRRVAEIVLAQQ